MRTLTRRDAPGDPLAARIERAELQFRDEKALCRALDGVDTLFNTYWVRFRARRDDVRARRREHARAPARGERRGRSARRACQRHQPVARFPAAVLPRQGGGRARRCRLRSLVRDRAPDARLRAARHPREQHRLGSSPQPGLSDRGRRELPRAARLGRGHGGDLRRCRRRRGERRPRRRRPGDDLVRRARAAGRRGRRLEGADRALAGPRRARPGARDGRRPS